MSTCVGENTTVSASTPTERGTESFRSDRYFRSRPLGRQEACVSGQTVDALNSTLKNTDLNELLDWMDKVVERKEKGPDWLKRMKDIHVLVTKDTSVGDAMERMDRKHVFLAIVTDEQGRPVQWFTTSEVRQLILQIS